MLMEERPKSQGGSAPKGAQGADGREKLRKRERDSLISKHNFFRGKVTIL
jgi:hypothetical protein